jgi:hypothetical protein
VLNVQKNGKQSMGHGPIKVAPSKQNKAGEDLIGIFLICFSLELSVK